MESIESRIIDFLERNPSYKITKDADRIEMMQLHNIAYPNTKEVSRNCCGCRARMWRKLIAYVSNKA